jgi:hypothetical protein
VVYLLTSGPTNGGVRSTVSAVAATARDVEPSADAEAAGAGPSMNKFDRDQWEESERIVLTAIAEDMTGVVDQLSDQCEWKTTLKTVSWLLHRVLGLEPHDPMTTRGDVPGALTWRVIGGQYHLVPDEDVVLEAYADRLANAIEWLPRHSVWKETLEMAVALLNSRELF